MSEWLLDPAIAYLNHGAFGALPVDVAAAADELRRRVERDPSDALARRLPEEIDGVRQQVCEFLGADPTGSVFVPNATTGTATVLASLASRWQPGDEVVVTDHRYPAVTMQLQRAAATAGIVIRVARPSLWPVDAAEAVDAVMAETGPRTRLIVVDAVASPTGLLLPVPEIVAAAHQTGIAVLVDAAHAPGQIEVDVRASGADFWVGNLHKWICSPRAAGLLSVAPSWRSEVRPLVASHGFTGDLHEAFDWTGTFDPVPLLAVPAALQFWQGQRGWDAVRRQQRDLVAAGAAVVAGSIGGRIGPGPDWAAAMRVIELPVRLSFDEGLELSRRLLAEHSVEAVFTTYADSSWVRICGQIYNQPADYERLAGALPELLRAGRRSQP